MQSAANDPGELSAEEAAYAAACAEAAAGRFEAARTAFLELRARLPHPSASLELQLAQAHYRLGDFAEAERALDAVIAIEPSSYYAHALRARLRADQGDAAGVEASLREAERLAPGDAHSWREIGQMHAEYWRWDDADRTLALAEAVDPGHAGTAGLIAIVKGERGDDTGARIVLERALARDPGDLAAALGYKLYLPQVYESAEDLERWRARYTRGLEEMLATLDGWRPRARQALDLNRTNFLLAYQGGDDRELQRGYSRLLGALAAGVHPEWAERPPRRFDGSRRLRVGFVGSIFRDCTAGRYFEHWITGLDRARFERRVYHASPIVDEFTQRIAAGCDHFATLRADGASSIAHLRAEALDVLVLPEVGMWPLSYLLAAVRVAPVQCAGWGHPVTTGGDAIDHFFTCADMEPPGAAAHYTERLVALPGLGVRYAMPPTAEAFAREKLRLPTDRRLYICPQSLFKIHPAMDAVFSRLLAADPGGVLVFFQSAARTVTERFAARLQRALASEGVAPSGQLKFLPRMNAAAFRRVLAAADVVVDTVHWSGGNTSLDAIAAGTPNVTLPGGFMRGRQSAAMLRTMGLAELIADSTDAYVGLAIAVASDHDRNRRLRAAIAERRGLLFDRPEPVAAFAEALLAVAAG
jgi:tetratricopeptide (TPR) repeat protein